MLIDEFLQMPVDAVVYTTLITLVPAAGLLGGLVPGGWRFVPADP